MSGAAPLIMVEQAISTSGDFQGMFMKPIMLALIVSLGLGSASAAAQSNLPGDAAKGAASFNARCGACHTVTSTDGAMAPTLKGVVGTKAGTRSKTFKYSPAMQKAAPVWTMSNLDKWLAAPQTMIPGSRMMTVVPNPQDRANIIAFLKTQK